MTITEETKFIIQIKSKRKNSSWRDYYVFDFLDRAIAELTRNKNTPAALIPNHTVRLIRRELNEVLLDEN